MADISDVVNIIDSTPEAQAILLKGIHGIGKSESIKFHMEERGYQMITLFLGQAADPGDIIGLPTKRIVRVPEQRIMITVAGKEVMEHIAEHDEEITDFAPPKWWPLDLSGKYILFLDEINRGKPEIMQCVMDMVLNRKLNGRYLPEHTRIIAAMNPLDDGYYQVEELDPALLDRFNVYDFKPTHREWLQWASEAGVHELVTSFISKHDQFLDPPSSKEAKNGEIYPSRRSWKRVSDIINAKSSLIDVSSKNLQTIVNGIVGITASAAFKNHVSTYGSGLTAEVILSKWDSKVATKVKALKIQDTMNMNLQMVGFFREKVKEIKDLTGEEKKKTMENLTKGLEKYLDHIDTEGQADFFGHLTDATNKQQEWPRMVINANKNVGNKFMDTIRGKQKSE